MLNIDLWDQSKQQYVEFTVYVLMTEYSVLFHRLIHSQFQWSSKRVSGLPNINVYNDRSIPHLHKKEVDAKNLPQWLALNKHTINAVNVGS